MNAKQRTAAAAKVITAHIKVRDAHGICHCGKEWNPLHVAQMLDAAGLLCALREETTTESELHQAFESIRALKAAARKEGINLS